MLEARVDDDVLELTLDTPGCDVNIFDAKTALAVVEALKDVEGARAVVVRSDKPSSFVNGAQLVMASAARNADDVRRLTAPVRAAYRALRDCPVPTIAAIRGTCFGCGVELALHCHYRVAADTWETQLYMTELADYLLVPAFGSTQDLPLLVGIGPAAEFLLWGARWTGREARAVGLVDAVVSDHAFDRDVRIFVEGVAGRPRTPGKRAFHAADGGAVATTRARIAALPPSYVPTYAAAFDLMERAARAGERSTQLYDDEIQRSGESLARPIAKAALSFFFVRQLAEKSTVRGSSPGGSYALAIEGDELAHLKGLVAKRNVRAVRVDDDRIDRHRIALAPEGTRSPRDADVAANVRTAVTFAKPTWEDDALLYAPMLDSGNGFVEVAVREPTGASLAIHHALGLAGFRPIITRPGDELAVDSLLRAYLRPIARFVERGGAPADADAALHEYGFVRRPSDLARAFSEEELGAIVGGGAATREAAIALRASTSRSTRPAGEAVDAVLLSLLAWALVARDRGVLAHPSIADVAAREVIDFPLGKGSLLRATTRAFAREAIPRVGDGVDEGVLERVARFVIEGKDAYA